MKHPIIENVETLLGKASDYLETRVDLIKLTATGKTADIVSTLLASLVIFSFALVFFVFLNLGIALWLGAILGKMFYGFFIVAGFYLLLGLLFYSMRNRWFKEPISNMIIQKILSKDENQ
jgi:hypothetical protein